MHFLPAQFYPPNTYVETFYVVSKLKGLFEKNISKVLVNIGNGNSNILTYAK